MKAPTTWTRGSLSSGGDRRARRQELLAAAAGTALLVLWTLLAVDCNIVVPRQSWSQRWGPPVPHNSFPGDCGLCHLPGRPHLLREAFHFDHDTEAGYPLRGAHARAACLRCHNDHGPVMAAVLRGCGGCHLDPHGAELGADCWRCHDEHSWEPATALARHARTRFPLLGAHGMATCESCHERAHLADYRGAPTECEPCHRRDLSRVRAPDHRAAGWSRDCERCHDAGDWKAVSFDHEAFPLMGGHAGVGCQSCHGGGIFAGLLTVCFPCHQDDFISAPDHISGNYSRDCLSCHSTLHWRGDRFAHQFFPLTGGHGGLPCTECHVRGSSGPIPSQCFSCHRRDYRSAPRHTAMSFPTDCANCHETAGWRGATFQHRFPLRGFHDVNCTACHHGRYPESFGCLVCHAHSRRRTDPLHAGVARYSYNSRACAGCHPEGSA